MLIAVKWAEAQEVCVTLGVYGYAKLLQDSLDVRLRVSVCKQFLSLVRFWH